MIKQCLSWVRIPESGFYSDMLTINIIGEAYSSVQKSVSDFVAMVGKCNVFCKASKYWLGLEAYKRTKR